MEKAVAELARRHPNPSPDLDPTAPVRTEFVFNVDSVPARFDAFVDGDEWVARAQVGPNFLTVVGNPFDPTDVALVRITDIDPYVIGTSQIFEHG